MKCVLSAHACVVRKLPLHLLPTIELRPIPSPSCSSCSRVPAVPPPPPTSPGRCLGSARHVHRPNRSLPVPVRAPPEPLLTFYPFRLSVAGGASTRSFIFRPKPPPHRQHSSLIAHQPTFLHLARSFSWCCAFSHFQSLGGASPLLREHPSRRSIVLPKPALLANADDKLASYPYLAVTVAHLPAQRISSRSNPLPRPSFIGRPITLGE
jgi:hypothetical protein